jgi:hypothetical protein
MVSKNLGRTSVPNRGLKSSESIYFPSVSRTQNSTYAIGWKSDKEIWSWDYLIEFIFPTHASPKYHLMATRFMEFLAENIQYDEETEKLVGISGEQISEFIKKNNFSSSSFYAYCLKKMLHVGLLERRRLERTRRVDTGSWCGKMLLTLSEQFLLHLNRISEWNLRLLTTAKENAKKKLKSSQIAKVNNEPDLTDEDTY